MKEIVTQKEIRMKSGTVIPAKTKVFCSPIDTRTCAIKTLAGDCYNVRYVSVFKIPTNKTLERYCFDAIAKTPLGKKTEPDGHDEFGFPAWPLILGVV